MNPKIISIEGNIGSGKSTIVHNLEKKLEHNKKYVFLREPVDIWQTIKDTYGKTILEKFYEDQEKYAFAFQVMAYATRSAILQEAIRNNPDCKYILCERSLEADNQIFAKMLNDDNNYEDSDSIELETFGASDVTQLSWIQLLNAYSCTECGRCTSECPANLSGKKLSPRKIMMDTRDRLTEISKKRKAKSEKKFKGDGKKLLGDYISTEEIWACTSCNACVESCPIDIDPLSIIMSMRQYLVLEKSAAPYDLNNMMNNIENNGAPWPFNQEDRTNWIN